MTVYRGGVGQWAWILHRATGMGVLAFLAIHILDTALVLLGPEAYNHVIELYRHPVFRVGEVGLFAAVLSHSLSGIRIIVVDFWVKATVWHKELFYAEMVLFVLLFLPGAFLMLKPLFAP